LPHAYASQWQHRRACQHHGDKELNSPNDVVVKRDGAIYFSDPSYGRKPHFGVPRPWQLDFRGVYRLAPGGKRLSLLAADFAEPNGPLLLARRESHIRQRQGTLSISRAFDVQADGTLANSRVWAKTVGEGAGAPDGMKIDSAGNLYCRGPGGIHVFAPDATALGLIKVPDLTANFCWGGDDLKGLFITPSTSLYRTRRNTPARHRCAERACPRPKPKPAAIAAVERNPP
jgi:gluconolactonase